MNTQDELIITYWNANGVSTKKNRIRAFLKGTKYRHNDYSRDLSKARTNI